MLATLPPGPSHATTSPPPSKKAKRSHTESKGTSFTLPDTDVSVQLIDGLSEEELLRFPAFKNWLQTLKSNLALQGSPSHEYYKSPYLLRDIKIQAVDRFGKRIGFLKLVANITNSEGDFLPGSIFLRGASVGMMVLLQPDDLPADSQDEKHVLLTVQSRIPAGGLKFVELPAGMVDRGSFAGTAAKEIKEEIGLEIPEEELINLSELAIPEEAEDDERCPRAMFPSSGGCDEYIPIFLHEKRIPREQLSEWSGRLTGLRDEGEKITLKLVKLEDLWREGARDAKALAAWGLYEGLRRTGRI
ncbi:hypothetical protein N431DRAFT_14755 [Stipitochalara longipes BDJ]|nr:hypothetical protein N431DRAFT_14755 [Stipitochalara longipes BDJ]